jgi:hypothetical protein
MRRGCADVSQDTNDWNELFPLDVLLPEKVFRRLFEHFKIEPLKKDNSKETNQRGWFRRARRPRP